MAIIQQQEPLQSGSTMDYDEFIRALKYLLDAAWGSKWGKFSAEGPNVSDPRNVEFPHITHNIGCLQPGMIGKNTREIKPRHRYFEAPREVNGTQPPARNIYGQVFETEMTFVIWEETNAQADKMAKQLRQLLSTYTGYFKEKGLKELIFIKQENDGGGSGLQDMHKTRTLTYFVKFEELTEVPTDIIRIMNVVDEKLQKTSE